MTDVSRHAAGHERFCRSLLDAMPHGLAELDPRGRIRSANAAFHDLLGLPHQSLAGRPVWELLADPEAAASLRDFFQAGPRTEPRPAAAAVRLRGSAGERETALEWHAIHGPGDDLEGFLLAAADRTERLAAEERLHRTESLAKILLDAMADAAFLLDSDGTVVAANQVGAGWLGSRPRDLIGRNMRHHIPWTEFEASLLHLQEVFCQGRPLHFEDQSLGRRLEHSYHPVKNRDGAVVLVAAFARDITRRHDLERLRQDVERIARHDIKSPLTGIIGLAQNLLHDKSLTDRQRTFIEAIRDAGIQVISLLDTSLDLLRMEQGVYELNPRPVDLSALLGRVESLLSPLLRHKHLTLIYSLDGQPWPAVFPCPVTGEERHLETLFTNLLKNACEAAPEASRITLSVTRSRRLLTATIHNPGSVPPPVRETFFDKYSTHGKAGGTGLGTYSARLIARIHGGDVTYTTSDTDGTAVTVTLPMG